MTVYLLKKNVLLYFLNNQKVIVLDIILSEVFVSIPCVPPQTFIRLLNKTNNLNYLFSHKIYCSINVFNVFLFFLQLYIFRRSE